MTSRSSPERGHGPDPGPPGPGQVVLDRARGRGDVPDRAVTHREEEILGPVAEGHSPREIAGMLVINVNTVERHRVDLLQKPGL